MASAQKFLREDSTPASPSTRTGPLPARASWEDKSQQLAGKGVPRAIPPKYSGLAPMGSEWEKRTVRSSHASILLQAKVTSCP